jgi:glucose-6-phosphate 1-dehydrogenase
MLSKKHLCREKKDAKIVIEKPFGKNKKTSHELNKNLLKAFDEKQIYRIDHYLGKETVQNVFFLRFGNTIFEPLWNRNYIENVQITVFEEMGIDRRGVFYEQSGIIRDIVQNHIMQLIALTAMEPPSDFKAESLRDERVKILKSIKRVKKKDFIIGQYEKGVIDKKRVKGYLDEENISKNSKTPTYFAGKFFIDNWRWEGVPFYVRTGKRLKKRVTEIAIHFKHPPLKLLGHVCGELEQNNLIFSIYPNQKISLLFNVKFPGMENAPYPVDMVFDYKKTFKVEPPLSYERLLIDLMKSDLTLFARQDGVETMWSIVDPIIESSKGKKLFKYRAGSLGPNISSLLQKEDVWRNV